MNIKDYPIIILCGGLGTRLKSVTGDKPKILATINQKSFLEIQFENLYRNGLRKFIYLTGFKSKLIEPCINKLKKTYNDCQINTFYEGKKRLGTGGALLKVSKEINCEYLLLTYGDNYLRLNYKKLISEIKKPNISN